MAALMFSMPFSTFAQQNVVSAKTANDTGSDGNTVILEAKAAAEQDASRDVNKLVWFGAGLVASSIIGWGGASVGCLVGGQIDPPSGSGLLYTDTISDGQIIGTLVGLVVGASIPLILIYNYKPNPPSERFIGKSPEYIDHYTDAYRKKSRSIRMGAAAAGCVLPGCLIGLAAMN